MVGSSLGAKTPHASQASVDQSSAVHPVDRFSEESVVGSTWASDGSGEVGGVSKDRVDDVVNSRLEEGVIPVVESATRVSGAIVS